MTIQTMKYNNQEVKNSNNNKKLRIKSHEGINKPKRKRITPYQFNILSDLFEYTDTPNYQLREDTAEKLNMTNREVQVWFQNRRAKFRNKVQEKKQDPFIYPIYWPSDQSYQEESNNHNHHGYDSQSSVTTTSSSSAASTPNQYPQLSPHLRPIDILALAAEYVQRCDEEKRLSEETRRSWRPWD